jgi:predicted esterase
MGGRGALYFAFRHPQRFAAVVAMSAVSPIADWAPSLAKTPLWYIHGAKDEQTSIADADALVNAVRAVGGSVRYTRPDDGDHFLLDRYYGRDWHDWLMEQRR